VCLLQGEGSGRPGGGQVQAWGVRPVFPPPLSQSSGPDVCLPPNPQLHPCWLPITNDFCHAASLSPLPLLSLERSTLHERCPLEMHGVFPGVVCGRTMLCALKLGGREGGGGGSILAKPVCVGAEIAGYTSLTIWIIHVDSR